MADMCRVLVVDDEENIRRLFVKEVAGPNRVVETAANGQEARKICQSRQFDVVVLDVCLPDDNGIHLLAELKKTLQDAEVVLITGYGTISGAVEAMKTGAYDYITKPFELERLEFVLEKAFERARLQKENRLLRKERHTEGKWRLVGQAEPIAAIRTMIGKVSRAEVPILITGQSGVGKDVVARVIHDQSPRRHKPLIIKNCATLQRELIRSELFGHIKGAFTGADRHQEGLLELAHNGTMFMDEIGDLPLEVQGMLLRVLEDQTYRRVGSKEERTVNVRFLFATNRDLSLEVREGRFHEALFHRINVFHLHVPELRERKADIPLLVEHFLTGLSPERKVTLSDGAMQAFMAYDWPGNVRELRNVLERCLILADDDAITEQDLPVDMVKGGQAREVQEGFPTLKRLEKEHIQNVLAHCNGHQSRAAEILGISRKTLYRKLQGLDQHGM
mgnify:CR=1 FL=1